MTRDTIESIADGYVEAALWADCMPLNQCDTCNGQVVAGREPGTLEHVEDNPRICTAARCESFVDESGGLNGRLEPTPESRAYVVALAAAFVEAAGEALAVFAEFRAFRPEDGDVWRHVGHDLRLSSGGHGTGFWDREPEPTNLADDGDRVRFVEARDELQRLAYDDRRFTRIGGGDVWQRDDDFAEFDPLPFHAGAGPGDRWECPPLTSAQRQAWIDSGRVPDVADTFPAWSPLDGAPAGWDGSSPLT